MKEDEKGYIDQTFYENLLGVDNIADDTQPDFPRAVVRASTAINAYCGNQIDEVGLENLSERQRFLVKKATALLVQHLLNTGEEDGHRGSASYSGGGQNFTYTSPLLGKDTVYIPEHVIMLLQQARLLTQVYGFDPIKEERRAKEGKKEKYQYRR